MSGETIKCPVCGKPYVFYSHYAEDQSACPKCRSEARGGGSLRERLHTSNVIRLGRRAKRVERDELEENPPPPWPML